ncbi:MAG: hypothetical protein NZ108_10650, partial [Bacteroidia bacterium]|nr:hypothetical protein [Bacteroidia bacterium]
DAVVKNLRIELQPNTVVVRYSVDYAGLVELYLKNPKNVYILKTGKVSEIGENEIKISRKKLKPGAEYTIEIEYKGKELIRKFVN